MDNGVFSTVNEAIHSVKSAFIQYRTLGMLAREEIISGLRKELLKHVDILAQTEYEETCMGNLKDKKEKILLAIEKTPGTEDLKSQVDIGDNSMVLTDLAAYGVACTIQPSTNPCGTIINNCISLIAAGNAVINCPHPRAEKVSKYLVGIIEKEISNICGINNLVVILEHCMISTIKEIMNHPDIELIVTTGGSEVASYANTCDKKVFSAGAGNPTFIVDETADIERAAHCIVQGASFDNNIMCITEKNIIVVREIAEKFKQELKRNSVYYVDNTEEMLKLSKLLLTEDLKPNKYFGGKSADEILKQAGIKTDRSYKLIAVETVKIHPFVTEELLIPIISIVVTRDFDEALSIAVMVEQNLRHTAGIHSSKIERLNTAARALQTSIFIKNGVSLNAIGYNSVGATSFTIANRSGEGATSARSFVRVRRCLLVDGFTIR